MVSLSPAGKTWHVRIDIDELGNSTSARASLDTGSGPKLAATGIARLNLREPGVREIGEEIASARALSQLGQVLLATAATDLAEVLHERVGLEELEE
jgi:uncharacterized protein DUF1876